MLDGLLGRGFSSKCKSLIKPTRTRIDVLRRRQEATQRFLKDNIAQLLANGLDINAFGRVKQTEEFLAGQNLLSCYDFIEQSCEYILKQLFVIQKQRECPEECREAVGSLMFAAARFSDLPELRDLRDTFQERYGSNLEHFVNQKFVEKLASRPPTVEKKLQSLQDIGLESSVKWDSRGFEQRIANPLSFGQDQPKKYGSTHGPDDKLRLPNGMLTVTKTEKQSQSSNGRTELTKDRHRVHNGNEDSPLKKIELELSDGKDKALKGREQPFRRRDNYDIGRREFTDDKHESSHGKDDSALKTVRSGRSSRGKRPEFVDSGYEFHNDIISGVPKREYRDRIADGKPEVAARVTGVPSRRDVKHVSSACNSHYGQPDTGNSSSKVKEEETDSLRSYSINSLPPPYIKSKDKFLPPPYVKSEDRKYGVNAEAKHVNSGFDGSMDPLMPKSRNVVSSILVESDHSNYEDQISARVVSHDHEKTVAYRDDIPLPRPRSIRRKHSKSSSNREDPGGNSEDGGVVIRSSSSRRRDSSRRGLQILSDDGHFRKDEEEKMMDKLLLHYSKKPSAFDPERLRETPRYGREGLNIPAEMVPPPSRSVSLPREPTAPTEAIKAFTRANSFQADKQAQHVHPKLPDYDDLAARFAALRGR